MSPRIADPPADHRVGAEIQVGAAPPIPGFRYRLYRGPEDHPGMIRANTAAREAAGVVERVTVAGMDNDYANLHNSDRYRDVIIGELTGEIVAYGRVEWGDNSDGARDYTAFCLVDPAVARRGIGRGMLEWQERRAREIAASQETDRLRFHYSFVYDSDGGGLALLSGSGYEVIRRGAEMVRPDLEAIPDVELPPRLAVRSAAASDARPLFDAETEIFRDHWGQNDESEESFAGFVGSPKFDPSLWVIAWDGKEIAGAVLTSIQESDAAGNVVGYLDSVGVRRPWRRRGLGRAIVAESLRLIRDRGATSAALGVDLQNQNEAARLYEQLGFHIKTTSTEFRKPLVL